MAVTDKLPYHLEIVQPKVPLVRIGAMNLKVLVHRDNGFDAPLTCSFHSIRPASVPTGAITVEKGKSEANIPSTPPATPCSANGR